MSEAGARARPAFRRFLSRLEAPPTGPRCRPFAEIVLPLALALGLTAVVRLTGFDLAAERWIFRVGNGSWALGEHPFWKWLYLGGTVPAALVVFAAVAAFVLTWSRERLRPWRRVFAFLILAGIIGPGVVTNGIVKEYWGRPRPRELVEFGGRSQFEPVLSYDASSDGLSFPCGHATMGFYFLVGWFLFRRHRPAVAQAFVFGSLVLGGLMGIARMAQGAHFFSDTIWAAVICWFVPMGIYYALGLDRSLVSRTRGGPSRVPLWMKGVFLAAGGVLLGAVLLATPYEEKKVYTPLQAFAKEGPLRLRLVLALGQVEIVPGEELRIDGTSYGHGVPTSKVGRNYLELRQVEGSYLAYSERISGWFKEVHNRLQVEIPWQRTRRIELRAGKSEVRLVLPPEGDRQSLKVDEGSGLIVVERGARPVAFEGGAKATVEGLGPADLSVSGDPSVFRLSVADDFIGTVRFEGQGGREVR